MTSDELQKIVRFTVMTVAGLSVDLGAVFALVKFGILSPAVAVAVGFLLGAIFNYLISATWVFDNAVKLGSSLHVALYAAIACCVLLTRSLSVAFLMYVFSDPNLTWLAILISVGISFCMNYGLSRLLFSTRTQDASYPKDLSQ